MRIEKADKKEFRPELLDELLRGVKTHEEMFGKDGLLKQLTGRLVERAPKAELNLHSTQERGDAEAKPNRSNGTTPKTLLAEQGPVPIEVARDRAGSFEPVLVPKHSRRIRGLDDKIRARCARGMSVRDIQSAVRHPHGVIDRHDHGARRRPDGQGDLCHNVTIASRPPEGLRRRPGGLSQRAR